MNDLDKMYLALLRKGLPLLQLAVSGKHHGWVAAEIDMLHNIPSLIGENNRLRHLYYWDCEREAYRDEVQRLGGEAVEYMECYYVPIWDEMAAEIEKLRPGFPS